MALTLKKIYEEVTTQAWSIFDSDISTLEDDDAGVISTIKKALSELWNAYDYSFKLKFKNASISAETNSINKPIGKIDKIYLIEEDGEETELINGSDGRITKEVGYPREYYIKYNKIYFKPVPLEPCSIKIDYYTRYPVLNEKEEPQFNFEELTDYVDIREEYEDLFLKALITRTMAIYPHPNKLINETYQVQAENAYKALVEASDVNARGKCVVW